MSYVGAFTLTQLITRKHNIRDDEENNIGFSFTLIGIQNYS